MHRITATLTDEQYAWLKRQAGADGRSLSQTLARLAPAQTREQPRPAAPPSATGRPARTPAPIQEPTYEPLPD